MPGVGALLLLAFVCLVVIVLLVLLQLTRLGFIVRTSIPDRPRRRMFLASVSFFLTFLGLRILVHLIVWHLGPFQYVILHGRHIHHLVWGIFILLLVGYGWVLDVGRAHTPLGIFMSRLMAISYGAGAALTLDEFSLWLDLSPSAYWSSAGRLSIDAVILFGALLAVGAGGAPFFRALKRMWIQPILFPGKLWRLSSTARRARLLRPRKARRSPRHSDR